MMNLLALGLVLTSLATAGFFTPSPHPKSTEDVIVKEGRRVVVVEYEKDDGNTKVLISPQDDHRVDERGFLASATDKLSEKMENVVDEVGEVGSHVFRPRELVCDAYGKCKHKIASAFEKTKEATAEKAHEAAGKVKETVAETAHKASDKVQEATENVKDSASKAKEKVSEKASGVREEAAKAKETVAEKGRAAEENARRLRKEGQKEFRDILRHAREVAGDAYHYVAPRERVAPVAGLLHLMGFAAAYGMCVWITFASSYVLAGALTRQQFAVVQSKIYPVYFKAMGCSVGMALLGHLVGPSRRLSPASVAAFQGLNLAAALAMILTNLLWLEPRATKVMLQRMKKEKEEVAGKEAAATTIIEPGARAVDSTSTVTAGRGPTAEEAAARAQIMELSQTLQRLNSYSSFLNALTLVSLTWHLVHLSQRLHTAC